MEIVEAIISNLKKVSDAQWQLTLKPRGPENAELKIYMDPVEGGCILMQMTGTTTSRPMAHQVMQQILLSLGSSLQRVDILEQRGTAYVATLHILGPGGEKVIEARPSHALALALLAKANVYVNTALFVRQPAPHQAKRPSTPEPASVPKPEQPLKERVRDMIPEDFGKFTMQSR